MKKLALIVLLGLIGTTPNFVSAFAGGDGSAGGPYQISTCLELQDMINDLDAYYVLTEDIDCSATTGWNSGAGFLPVGSTTATFIGSLDGQGFTISDLFIDRSGRSYVGLLGRVGTSATTTDLGLINVDITGGQHTGGLIGLANAVGVITVESVHTTGSVTASASNAGGLIGNASGVNLSSSYSTATVGGTTVVGGLVGAGGSQTDITDSYATGNVTGSGDDVGGLVGSAISSTLDIFDSYATGDVSSTGDQVGGFIGKGPGTIRRSYATGNVSTTGNYVGGFIGGSWSGDLISDSFATGDVNGGNYVGGFAGESDEDINRSYSTGSVTGTGSDVGGFSAVTWGGAVSDSFWDTQTSGTTTSVQGTGKTTAQMKDVATYTDTNTTGLTSAWDFLNDPNDDGGSNDYWAIDSTANSGYPFLTSFYSVPDAPTGLSASVQSYNQINLSWTAPADNGGLSVTGYKIERKIGSGSYSTLVSDTGDTSTSYQDTGLSGSTLYTYKVSAINAIGAGSASSEASATTYKEPTGSVINIMRGNSDDADDETEDEEQAEEDGEEQDEQDEYEETDDGEMSQEEREAMQEQINEIREIINQLIEQIKALYGLSV